MLTSGTYFLAVVVAAMVAYVLAHRKGLNAPGWAWATLFLIVPVLLLPFVKSRLPEATPTGDLGARWDALAAYDPDVKAAVARLAPLGEGAGAGDELRRLYGQVQDKAALPAIVVDLERKWAGYAALGLAKCETRAGVDILRDAQGLYHVAGRQSGDLRTARAMATAAARRARGA